MTYREQLVQEAEGWGTEVFVELCMVRGDMGVRAGRFARVAFHYAALALDLPLRPFAVYHRPPRGLSPDDRFMGGNEE